ncbi:MAG: DUF86 domain-containing protein [Dehalococcoidia bacterium]|nr:DUF86 domain-containing protein [Dehalococcoidia bacterium]
MTDARDRRHLMYIRDSIALVEARTRGGREAFLRDVDLQDSVLWRLETLAEVTGRLSDTIKTRHPEINWRAMYGFRNIVAHGYLELRLDQVWEIIDIHLPALKATVQQKIARG